MKEILRTRKSKKVKIWLRGSNDCSLRVTILFFSLDPGGTIDALFLLKER
jgi:hypothetical protein